MKNLAFLFLALLVVAGAGAYYYYNKPVEKTISATADVTVSAEKLYADYAANEEQANAMYLNKVLLVTGKLGSVSESDSVTVTYSLDTADPMATVTCNVDKSMIEKNPEPGTDIRIKGLCTGLLMDVVLVKCSIEE